MMTLHPTKYVMKLGMVTHTATGDSGGDEPRPYGRSPRGKFQPPHNVPPIHRRGGIYSRPRKNDLFPPAKNGFVPTSAKNGSFHNS